MTESNKLKHPSTRWLIKNSLRLDYNLLFHTDFALSKKLEFLSKKYFLVARHLLTPFRLGDSRIVLHDRRFYYDTKYGMASYQRILTTHYNLLRTTRYKFGVVIDVGASTGIFSKLMRELNSKTNLYMFEPAPPVYDCLVKNFANDQHAFTYNQAVSNTAGRLHLDFTIDRVGLSQIAARGIAVEATTLDQFITNHQLKRIDLLKIDVEGHENFVLEGAQATLKATKYVLLEVSVVDNPNYTFSSLIALLNSQDFNFQLLAFRNHSDKGEGPVEVMDLLLENVMLKS